MGNIYSFKHETIWYFKPDKIANENKLIFRGNITEQTRQKLLTFQKRQRWNSG